MILHRYFAARFLRSFATVMAAFAAIAMLTSLVELIGELSDKTETIWPLAGLALLQMPKTVYGILPLVVVLAGVSHFIALGRSSELVVSRAAGQSATHALFGPGFVVIVIGLLAAGAGNPIVASTSKAFEARRAIISGATPQVTAVGPDGLWLREGTSDGHRIIRAAHANADGTLLSGVSFYDFSADGTPVTRVEAATARLLDGAWTITGSKTWDLTSPHPERAAQTAQEARVPTTLTVEGIRDGFGSPSAIPIWNLPGFINDLRAAGFSATRHVLWFHSELTQPVFLLAMLTVAAGLTMGHQRGGRTGIRVLAAVMMGFGLYFVRNFVMVLGENGQLHPVLAAWAPPIAAWMLAFGILLQREDG